MIRYDLLCDSDHEFDGWYRDSETFDALVKAGQVQCSGCGSVEVRKALMTPSLGQKQNQQVVQTKSDMQKDLVKAVREVRRMVDHRRDKRAFRIELCQHAWVQINGIYKPLVSGLVQQGYNVFDEPLYRSIFVAKVISITHSRTGNFQKEFIEPIGLHCLQRRILVVL